MEFYKGLFHLIILNT